MSEAEKRISTIEIGIPAHPMTGVSRALCEIARQLARIADLYEFELGLDSETHKEAEAERQKRAAEFHAQAERDWNRIFPNGYPPPAETEVPWTEDK